MTRLTCDPPSGWRYGFPKEMPEDVYDAGDEAVAKWLAENGYPEEDAEFGARYCRYWGARISEDLSKNHPIN